MTEETKCFLNHLKFQVLIPAVLLLVALKSFGSPEANHPVLAAIGLTPEAPEQFFRFSQNCDGGLCKALYS